MKIDVQWFAAFREATGVETETVNSEAPTAQALFEEMKIRHPRLASTRGALVAINGEMSDWSKKLSDGDTILFFPPVAGG